MKKNKILSVLMVCSFLSAEKLEMNSCVELLEGGIYNGGLEYTCGFKGSLSKDVRSTYTKGGCREVVPQSKVEQLSKDVTNEMDEIIKRIGKKEFCEKNMNQYYVLWNSF